MKPILISIAAGSLLAALALAQTPRYTVIDLGTLPGGTSSMANYLNDNRLIAGNAANAGGTQQAIFWWGPLQIDIGTPGLNSGIFGVNTSGQASISAEISAKDPNNENFCAWGTGLECAAFLLQSGVPIQLPTLGGYNSTLGNINSKGEIAGATENSTRDPDCPTAVTVAGTGPQYFDYEAVVWGPNPGSIRELKPLPGDTVGMSLWINDNSQAVGASGTCANTVLPPLSFGQHAVLWDTAGTAHDLGNLGSKVINMALSINNQGQVTGVSAVNDQAMPGSGTHAFLWTSAAGMQDLGTLPGDAATVGSMINDAGDVVGPSFDPSGNPRAYLWHNGVMSDLNDLVPGNSPLYLLFSTAINSYGEISGYGATEKGDVHGFLAIPSDGAAGSSPTALSANRPMALSENVRALVRQRLALGRTGYRLNGPW
jgi:probable HAF family extracellular repeat protein